MATDSFVYVAIICLVVVSSLNTPRRMISIAQQYFISISLIDGSLVQNLILMLLTGLLVWFLLVTRPREQKEQMDSISSFGATLEAVLAVRSHGLVAWLVPSRYLS